MQDRPATSIRSKIILFCISIAVATTVLDGAVALRGIADLSRDRAAEMLANETRNNGERFLLPFQQMQQDAAVVAGTPTVAELFRMQRGQAVPAVGEGLDQWRRQLEAVFRAQLEFRPHYSSIRMIDLRNGGREIVRVDAIDGEARAIQPDHLRRMENAPFIQSLMDGDPQWTSFFSTMSRHDQSGVVSTGSSRVVSLVHPVSGADGGILGAVVIDSDFDALVAQAKLRIHPDSVFAASLGTGAYAWVQAGASLDLPEARHSAEHQVSAIKTGEANQSDGLYYFSDDKWTQTEIHEVLPGPNELYEVRISTAMPTPVVMQPMRAMLRNELLSAVMILLATTAIAWMFGVRLTRPLAELTKHISQRGSLDHLKFDDPSRDEVWSLVRAFAEMSNDLILEAGQARKVFEHAVDGLLTTDGHGTILTINPAAYRMFGHPPGSLEGQPISRLIPESYRAAHDHHMDRLLSNEAQPMAELREVSALRLDGACFPVEVRVSRVSNDGGGLFVAIVHDITTRLEAEREQRLLIEKLEGSNATNAELERAKAELERSNAELDRFAYVASHDLRAPLRVIDNASRWLEEDLAEHLDDDTRESMDLLRSRVFRMEQLLKDLLEHSRIGRVSLSDAMVDGRELVENIWALTAMPDAFHFEVDAVFEAITLPQFPIQTVLVNLVSNAVKHHDRPNGKVSLSVSEATDHYVFEVTDDGPGIPAQYQEKVFDMFQTLKPRDDVEGSGMGLAIVKKTIEVAGGAIHLTSVLGEGCCFRVTWPRARTQAGEEAAA